SGALRAGSSAVARFRGGGGIPVFPERTTDGHRWTRMIIQGGNESCQEKGQILNGLRITGLHVGWP
ncbi:MAG: hypothetical protein PHC30_01450, partial [Lentisphaeria bacterium]|nr:hypothetical protein [Lentisphaeria bacterium]